MEDGGGELTATAQNSNNNNYNPRHRSGGAPRGDRGGGGAGRGYYRGDRGANYRDQNRDRGGGGEEGEPGGEQRHRRPYRDQNRDQNSDRGGGGGHHRRGEGDTGDRDRDRDRGHHRYQDRERGGGGGGRGPRGFGRGSGHPSAYRGRGPLNRSDEPEVPSKTLVIKDADNEFLRMLKEANEAPNSRVPDDEDPMREDRRHTKGHSRARQFTSMQPSRDRKPSLADSDKAHKACPVCLMDSPSLTGELVQAFTSCEHIYCFECALRLIFITEKPDCPICRQTLTKVVLTRAETLEECPQLKSFLATSTDPAIAQNTTSKIFLNFAKMVYFDGEATFGAGIFDLIKRLLWFNCPFCPGHLEYAYKMTTKCRASYDAISQHLRKHDRNLCDLCFFNLELFPYEYDFYTNYEMDQHKRLGSSIGDAQVQHRRCNLCPKADYYFNNESLSEHCKEAHISCYVCNSQTIFFVDQPSLVEHVSEAHIFCPECQRTNGQVIGFLSVIELRSHALVEHPAARIDYEGLAKASIAKANAFSGYGHDLTDGDGRFNPTAAADSNMSRREAFDEIDNLLRHRFSTERHLRGPSFNPENQETYMMNFPQIEGLSGMGSSAVSATNGKPSSGTGPKGKKSAAPANVNLFPGSKYRMMSGQISGHNYEEQFPGLGGGGPTAGGGASKAKSTGSGASSIAATAASVKFKPQNWQAPSAAASQFLKTPVDLTGKKAAEISKKLKPKKSASANPESDEPEPSIYDDMIFTNPLEAPQTIGISKPKSVQLIDSLPSAAPSSTQSVYKKPPPLESFPALGRPGRSLHPGGGIGGVNFSKALSSAPKPKPKKAPESLGASRPEPARSINLNDGESFPGLADGGGRPGWLGPATGKWAANGGKKKKRGKAALDDEWLRPDGTSNGTSAGGEDENEAPDPYITHLATSDRNNVLRSKVRKALAERAKGNASQASEGFTSFKELSLSFRSGAATPQSFFELGRDLLGADTFDALIGDLISLLPNIAKQNELYDHLQTDPRLKGSRSAVLWKCPDCQQLAIFSEKAEHTRYHAKAAGGRR